MVIVVSKFILEGDVLIESNIKSKIATKYFDEKLTKLLTKKVRRIGIKSKVLKD